MQSHDDAIAISIYIDYGDIIYGAASDGKTNKLQKIQNQCLRICSNSDIRTSVIEMHRRARVANLKDRRLEHLKNFMFKMKTNENLIDRRQRNTRAYDAIVFTTQFPRCNKYKQSTLFRGATAWNQLPVHERNIASYSRFKYIQKRAMLEVNNFLFPQ